MRVVVDPNVLVSAVISPTGSPREVVAAGDKHLIGLAEPEPPVLTPRQFLDRLANTC